MGVFSVLLEHNGLQQFARLHLQASEGGEKWSDSKTGKVNGGLNAAIFANFLHQNAIPTYKTRSQARIHFLQITTYCFVVHIDRL